MTVPTLLAGTWSDGLFIVTAGDIQQELAGQSVGALAADLHGGALALVDHHSLCRRRPDGAWSTLATSDLNLDCVMAVDDMIYLGTEDAHVLRVDGSGRVERLATFDAVEGRDSWYAGSAIVDGKIMGPPLAVRSMTATTEGRLLVGVHIGGIARSTDHGLAWHPTIDIEDDVHEVRAHPTLPNIVAAAAAVGLLVSFDGGATWKVEDAGLDASYCSAVAFCGDDIFVAASEGHFAARGAIYRRPIHGAEVLEPVANGLPRWLDGIADTGCVTTHGSVIAVADKAGNAYVSVDGGDSWECTVDSLPGTSSLLLS